MEKMVHIWSVKCKACGYEFKHIFRARDLLRPHIITSIDFKCPKCGEERFDPVKVLGKQTLQQWQTEHPELDINQLPDYDYTDEDDVVSD